MSSFNAGSLYLQCVFSLVYPELGFGKYNGFWFLSFNGNGATMNACIY